MTRRKIYISLAVVAMVIVAGGLVLAQLMRLPKPQTAFVEGQAAPDFTLQDGNGQPFHLASTRGSRVVLIFYRGYW
jgi:cytochrome oxidase Cu insertion factor (SCO1/SenC/PrrC family)